MPNNNDTLSTAKTAQNDEYYTLYEDIQNEINRYVEYNPDVFKGKTILLPCDDPEWSNFTKFFAQNFETLGLKKLISTSYATESKNKVIPEGYQFSLFDFLTDYEKNSPNYDETKTMNKGKVFVLTRDVNDSGVIDYDDLEWDYLEGDGDFRSNEVTSLRDEADIIITNPPFSLFREFMAWIMEAKKQFLILGNPNLLSKRDIFPLIKDNKIWVGCKSMSKDSYFIIPEKYKARLLEDSTEGSGYKTIDGVVYGRSQAIWYTNLEHGRRHGSIPLMSMEDNLKYSKHKGSSKWAFAYKKFENYDAIEVPFVNSIPNDYKNTMAVPISFIDQYCPEQFEILGRTGDIIWCNEHCTFFTPCSEEMQKKLKKANSTWRVQNAYMMVNDKAVTFYDRIFIKYTDDWIINHPENFKD
ncbi:MAG: DNA methyltransferase [Clostridia bacterium]|nr:DNA methyltransferase [Clostridia bacterium]